MPDFTQDLDEKPAPARQNPFRNAVRYDPRHRHATGLGVGNGISNPEPDRKYCLVRKDDIIQGPDYFEYLGYEVERHWEGGPRLMIGKTARHGEPIEFMGSVLMSIDKRMHAELVAKGAFGSGGQEGADRTEKQIVAQEGGMPDGLRGIRNRYITVQNVTEPTTTEYVA